MKVYNSKKVNNIKRKIFNSATIKQFKICENKN